MKKKVVALTLALTLAAGLVTGCGNAKKDDNKADSKTITVAASQTPHSEILAEAAKTLKKQGYDLKVTVFDDYVQPNNVVESGEFDANYVEHKPYMEQFNKENGTHIVDAGDIHYEPFGIYGGTKTKLEDVAEGDTIAIPNDTTNEARALLLLHSTETNGNQVQAEIKSEQQEEDRTISFGFFGMDSEQPPVTGWLVCIQGAQRGSDFRLHSGKNFLGRSPSMDIVLADDKTVSRDKHCSVVYDPKGNHFYLAPEKGNIVLRNGNMVERAEILQERDTLQLGETILQFIPFCQEDITWEEE